MGAQDLSPTPRTRLRTSCVPTLMLSSRGTGSSLPTGVPVISSGLIAAVVFTGAGSLLPAASLAGTVNCTTTLEAPILPGATGRSGLPAPVEVTRCAPVESIPELMERRAYTWTAPYESGVDVSHQLAGILGVSLAGQSGYQFMGFGFPEQTLIWDSSAIRNTTAALMDLQVDPMPKRTRDLATVFTTSLAGEGMAASGSPARSSTPAAVGADRQVRGLW